MHDVVIVGGGTAGCVLASRLTENPSVSVLLIEAGRRSRKLHVRIPAAFSKLYRTEVDWGDSTTPQPALDGREIVFPRGRMPGGSAAMNAMPRRSSTRRRESESHSPQISTVKTTREPASSPCRSVAAGASASSRAGALLAGSRPLAGAIGTPHLLQLSGIGPRCPLEAAGVAVVHEHPSVGANLLDHLANGLLVRSKGVETLASAESLPNLLRWALLGRGPLTSNLGEVVAFVRSRPDVTAPDLELRLAPVLFEEEGLRPPSEHGLTLAVVLLEPRSSGTVLLRSADPRVPPAIDPRYLTDPGGEDAATLLRGLRLARRVLAQEPLAALVDVEILPGADARSDGALLAHIARCRRRSTTRQGRVAWGPMPARWSIRSFASAGSPDCASPTLPSFRSCRAATRTGPP